MRFFETKRIYLRLSPSETKQHIENTCIELSSKHDVISLYWRTWDRFRTESKTLVTFSGKIENIDHSSVNLYIKPKIKFSRLALHLLVLTPTFIGVLLTSVLMLDTNIGIGICLLILNGWILIKLYKNLIGRPRKQVQALLNRLTNLEAI